MANNTSGIIATREYLLSVDDIFLPLTVSVFAPRPSLDRIIPGMNSVCAFLFSNDVETQNVLGVDSLEALFNALVVIDGKLVSYVRLNKLFDIDRNAVAKHQIRLINGVFAQGFRAEFYDNHWDKFGSALG